MINKNSAVEIRPAVNGFIVTCAYNPAYDRPRVNMEDTYVFQSMQSLEIFLREHFNFRCGELHEDASST